MASLHRSNLVDLDHFKPFLSQGGAESPRVRETAAKGGLTVAGPERPQFANRAPAGDLAGADVAKACSALPGGTATAGDGSVVDVSAACGAPGRRDRTTDTGSRGALLLDRFRRRLTASNPAADLWLVPFSAADPVRTPRTVNRAAPGIGRALADTVAGLRAAGIALDAPLGEHRFVFRDGRKLPVGGGTEVLGVRNRTEARWNAAAGGHPDVAHGSSHIQAVGPGRQFLPGGPHAADVRPVLGPGLAVPRGPDPAVPARSAGSGRGSASGTSSPRPG